MILQMRRVGIFAVLLLVFSTARGQQVSPAGPAPLLESIISSAASQREVFIERFKDLLSQETKTIETFDKNGGQKKKRTIVSTFIVYQSLRGESEITEYRNVISVDGKKVENADQRAQEFFAKVARPDASERELDQIEKEGSRFDQDITINGLTLFQAVILAPNIRPDLEFKLDGMETLNGHSAYRISYTQKRDNRYISIESSRAGSDGKPSIVYDIGFDKGSSARITGRLWIDADTYQIRKEERILTVQGEGDAEPFKAVETVLNYADSPFGILTPSRLSFTQYQPGKKGRDARKDVAVTFEYDAFTRPDVEVKSADVKN